MVILVCFPCGVWQFVDIFLSQLFMTAQVPSHEGDRDIGEKADIQMPGLLGPKEG